MIVRDETEQKYSVEEYLIFVSLVPFMSADLLAYQHVSTLENGLFIQMFVQNNVIDLFVSLESNYLPIDTYFTNLVNVGCCKCYRFNIPSKLPFA